MKQGEKKERDGSCASAFYCGGGSRIVPISIPIIY